MFNSQFALQGINEEEIQDQLDKEEAAALKATGRLPLHQTSASSFLIMGLELEESRYVSSWKSQKYSFNVGSRIGDD